MKGYGFFTDSDGNRSYGRMASFCLVLGAYGLAYAGKTQESKYFLIAAVTFYFISKAQQASFNYVFMKFGGIADLLATRWDGLIGKGSSNDATGSVGRTGETR